MVMIKHPRYITVATSRVALNIFLACRANPVKNPVEPNDKMFPMEYNNANFIGCIHNNEDRKEQMRPMPAQQAKPYNRCSYVKSMQIEPVSSSSIPDGVSGCDGWIPALRIKREREREKKIIIQDVLSSCEATGKRQKKKRVDYATKNTLLSSCIIPFHSHQLHLIHAFRHRRFNLFRHRPPPVLHRLPLRVLFCAVHGNLSLFFSLNTLFLRTSIFTFLGDRSFLTEISWGSPSVTTDVLFKISVLIFL